MPNACVIEYSKAVDTVKYCELIERLQSTGIDESDIALIATLCWQELLEWE